MASYLQGVTDQSLQTPLPTYDWGFLAANQQKKEGQYQQGLSEVSAGYSAIVNAPVTGEGMKQVQQEYARTAQEGLKKLATTDLSLPKNVVQAESLYAPFWQDQGLLINTGLTKFGNNNIQRVQSGLFSKDEETRSMYDPIQVQDQQGMLEELAAAGTDINRIKAVEQRQLVPFRNIKNDLNEKAAAQKLEIKWDHPEGPYIVSTVNGSSSVPSFKTWAKANVGSEYAPQLNVVGRVAYDNAKRRVRAENPGIPDNEINSHIAENAIREQTGLYINLMAENTTSTARLQKKIEDVLDRGVMVNGKKVPTPNDQELYSQLTQQLASFTQYGKDVQREYSDFATGAQKEYNAIVANPAQAFARMEKDNIINNFAAGMSANESRTIKENTAFAHQVTEQRLSNDLAFQIQKEKAAEVQWQNEYNLKVHNQGFLEAKEGVKFDPATGGFTGGSSFSGNPVDAVNSGTVDVDATAFKHETNPYERYNQGLNNMLNGAINDMFSVDGAAQVLINTPITVDGVATTLSVADIDIANGAILKKANSAQYVYSPQEETAVKRMGAAIGAKEYDPVSMEAALSDRLGREEMDKDGIPNIQSARVAQKVARANDALEQRKAMKEQVDAAVKTHVLGDPVKFDKVIDTDINGQPTIVTPQTMGKKMPEITIRTPDGGTKVLSGEEVARMRMAGTEVNKIPGIVLVNGQPIQHSLSKNGQSYSYYVGKDGSLNSFDDLPKYLSNKYGTPKEFATLYTEAQNNVMTSIPEYNATSGIRGMQIGYNDNNVEQRPVINSLTNALSVPSNISGMYVGGELLKDAKNTQVLQDMLKTGNKYIQATEYELFGSPDGGPAIKITFKPEKETDKTAVGDTKITDITSKGSIVVAIDKNTRNPLLQSLMNAGGNTMYSDMVTTGKKYQSDNIQEAHNFHYEIQPTNKDASGKYTQATIILSTKVINPETGQLETRYPFQDSRYQTKFPSIDFSKQTPYQIRSMIDQYYQDYLQTNIANYKQYQKVTQNKVNYHTLETAQ